MFVSKKEEVLGSIFEIEVPEEAADRLELCFSECKRIEEKFSRFLSSSELSRLNEQCGKRVSVSDEMFELLLFSQEMKTLTEGVFDVCVHDLLVQLGYDAEYSFQEKDLSLLAENKGFLLHEKDKSVTLFSKIDFGGFGKGYALERLSSLLGDLPDFYVNAGGDLFAKGKNKAKKKWTVALEHPFDTSLILGTLNLDAQFLAASSSNRRRWGKSHHLVNLQTRQSAEDMGGVFVLHSSGKVADTLATALFVMGYEKAIAFAEEKKLAVLLVSPEGEIFYTEDFPVEIAFL